MPRGKCKTEHLKKKKAFVRWLRANLPCSECGVSHPDRPYLIEFDHRFGDKRMGVADMLSQDYSMKMILDEMAKTAATCGHCHSEMSYDGKERTSLETLSRVWLEEKWDEWKDNYQEVLIG